MEKSNKMLLQITKILLFGISIDARYTNAFDYIFKITLLILLIFNIPPVSY